MITSAHAQSITLETLLNKCDVALNAEISAHSLCNQGLSLRDSEIERLNKENAELAGKGSSLFDNPLVWVSVGLIAGVFVGSRITK